MQSQSAGIGFFGLLAIVFIVLKLVGIIKWSWLWVLAPIWGPLAVVGAILIFVAILAAIVATGDK